MASSSFESDKKPINKYNLRKSNKPFIAFRGQFNKQKWQTGNRKRALKLRIQRLLNDGNGDLEVNSYPSPTANEYAASIKILNPNPHTYFLLQNPLKCLLK